MQARINWQTIPLIRIVIISILGIYISYHYPQWLEVVTYVGAFSLVASSVLVSIKGNVLGNRMLVISNFVAILAGSYLLFSSNVATNYATYFGHHTTDSMATCYIKLLYTPEPKSKSYKAIADVIAVKNGNTLQPTTGKILLYFSNKDTSITNLQSGDELWINTAIQPIAAPTNPDVFDYKKYLFHQNIHHQGYIKEKYYQYIKSDITFLNYIEQLRNALISIFIKKGIENPALALTNGLLLGYRRDIDKDTIQLYSETGVIHILAVSGLHVGMVYMVLVFLISLLPFGKKGIFRSVFIISLLLIYAVLTGFTPSVLRSTLVFILVELANNILYRRSNAYNLLAGSALLLILYDAHCIFDIGFQLSYAAVLGILVINPILEHYIHKIYIPINFFSKHVTSLLTISTAAQIATLPICVYYFHQFPVYFLLANLVAVPISTLVIYIGIALWGTYFVPYWGDTLAFILQKLIFLLTYCLQKISDLPFAIIRPITIHIEEMLLLYFVIISGVVAWYFHSKKWLLASSICFISFCGIHTYHYYETMHHNELIVYHTKGSVLQIINSQRTFIQIDTSIKDKNNVLAYTVQPHSYQQQIEIDSISIFSNRMQKNPLYTPSEHGFIWQGYSFLCLDATPITVLDTLHVDYVLVSNSPKYLASIMPFIQAKQWVLDGSNKGYWYKKNKVIFDENGINYHSVYDKGAWQKIIE